MPWPLRNEMASSAVLRVRMSSSSFGAMGVGEAEDPMRGSPFGRFRGGAPPEGEMGTPFDRQVGDQVSDFPNRWHPK